MAMLLKIPRSNTYVKKNIPSIIFLSRHSSSLSDDYQFLQQSVIPTMHFQPSLPRLPIPKLEKTCERYLAAQRPLLIDEAYRKTETNVKRFLKSTGRMLHEKLVTKDKNNKHTSYISEPWFDMYLKDRTPLPINYNPFFVHVPDPKPEYNNQLTKATNLLVSSLRFMRSLRENILDPEIYYLNPKVEKSDTFKKISSMLPSSLSWYAAYLYKAYPLDMSQYSNLFNTTRVPEMDKDRIVQNVNKRHILVMRRGNFYIFDVLDESGNILPPNVILAKLKLVLEDATPPPAYPIGILTTENRNVWATSRHFLETIGNEKAFRLIDSAIFNLILDDDNFEDDVALVRNFLHGDGINRWFDKSLSLIISKNGVSGINFEHSWGDGVAVLRFFEEIYKDSVNNPQVHPDTQPAVNVKKEDVTILEFKIDNHMERVVKDAIQKYKDIYSSLDINILLLDGLGKEVCKKSSVSPDAIMQLGFQSAYFKQHAKYTSTYESCSTAAFRHGRTETVRPCTMATKEFCDTLHLRRADKSTLRDLIKQCSQIHKRLTTEAAMGQGFDRHMFSLKNIAEVNGLPISSIFQDLSYAALNYNRLSTSTLGSPYVHAGGFGPVVKDGYGIGYVVKDTFLGCMVINYLRHQNGPEFVDCLKQSYNEILDILSHK